MRHETVGALDEADVGAPELAGSDSAPSVPPDALGAMRILAEQHVLAALGMVRQGRVYDLSHVLEPEMPMSPFHGDYQIRVHRSLEEGHALQVQRFGTVSNGYAPQNRRLDLSDQTGTHIDNLNHVGVRIAHGNYLMFGGIHESAESMRAIDRPGIEMMPALIGRAVLLDIAGALGVAELPAGHAISVDQLREAGHRQGTAIGPGDTVLIHTGWGRHWDPGGLHEMLAAEPGLSAHSARWLADQGVVCVGADNFAVEVVPPEMVDEPFPAHIDLLVRAGVRMLENLCLEQIVADGVRECCLIVAPLKIKGGTGSPVRPLALI